ncbi:MAG: tRNA preQ1(34) S-adenosylmethionine ribosyltransferase-isomerase QueA [Desulfomonilaceae bacterium]
MKRDEPKIKDPHPGQSNANIPHRFRLHTYTYDLPPELIAQEPALVRDESRLLVLHPAARDIQHHRFRDLPSLLRPSDLLVVNETKVTPASLVGRKPSGGRVDLLVLDPWKATARPDGLAVRTCLVRSSKRLRRGAVIQIESGPEITVEETVAPGRVRICFPVPEDSFLSLLELYGRPPLPPYIRADRGHKRSDRERYQTIYAKVPGSVAAPTAGLHFTGRLLEELQERGISIVRIHLRVGPGTFTPVRVDDIRLHRMESESYEISEAAAGSIAKAYGERRRIIAVGTTTVRALESAAIAEGIVMAGKGETDLFILPGHSFKVVRGMVTNFHLPGSTLLMLVCALGGTDLVMSAYSEAVKEQYRFFSYGDACLVVD